MLRIVMLAYLCGFPFLETLGQLRRFYELNEPEDYDTVDFTLKATSGISFVRQVDGGQPLNIFGNPDLEHINPSFHSQVQNSTCHVKLTLDEYRKSMVGDGLVFAMLGKKEEEEENYWKFLLNDQKVYNLNLNYGIGSSDVDLSGTAVNKLKITTGSADVVVDYAKQEMNRVDMDTFLIKVDLGSIVARNLNHTRAKTMIAEVGFGQGELDFSKGLDADCEVFATVGAGTLDIILPKKEPVIIHMTKSPLCSINMPTTMEHVEQEIYVSVDYDAEAENLLTIHVEVAMGAVNFTEAED